MDDLATWLEAIGLAKYTAIFIDNEIDCEILPELSDQDFKELGLSLGARKKLLKAITSLPQAPESTETKPFVKFVHSKPLAERRQLTVMFVDLVGSTELSSRLDPEELGEMIRRYQNVVAGEISRYKGHVAQFMGDGVLAYFGWPKAHEDEAQRAVLAGLDVNAALNKFKPRKVEFLTARIGIATGLVVVGDLIGEGPAQQEAVIGETPNLAARLQALAEPGSVVISESTKRLVGKSFELQALSHQCLKGIPEFVTVYKVLGQQIIQSRFHAHQTGAPLPLIGRGPELGTLLDCWHSTQKRLGHCVIISGEAGIGKSRIVQAFIGTLGRDPHTIVSCQLLPAAFFSTKTGGLKIDIERLLDVLRT